MVHIDDFRHNMMTEERGIRKSRSFNLKKMLSDVPIPGRQSLSFVGEIGHSNFLVETIDDERKPLLQGPISEPEAREIVWSPRSRLNVGFSPRPSPGTPLPSSGLMCRHVLLLLCFLIYSSSVALITY